APRTPAGGAVRPGEIATRRRSEYLTGAARLAERNGETLSIEIMPPHMLERMRASCRMAAECLVMVGENLRAGMTTEDINTLVHEWIVARGAYPSPLQYGTPPFPKSVCTSVNECVCHGIPSPKQVLRDGDIINVDVTTY